MNRRHQPIMVRFTPLNDDFSQPVTVNTAAEDGQTSPHVPFTHPHATTRTAPNLRPVPFFYPKSPFPVTMGDVAQTKETVEYTISSGKMSRKIQQPCSSDFLVLRGFFIQSTCKAEIAK